MSELFSAFGINWKLLLIQAVNFGLLLSALTYFLYKPVLKIIDDRQKTIADGVRTAQLADKKLEDAKTEGEQMVGSAAREAEGLVAGARVRAEERGQEIVRAAEERAQATMKDAAERAEEAQRAALKASQQQIARAAMLAAEKILLARSVASGEGGREKSA
jgi:F-type H+-transporting ATPase subunit b